MKLYEYKEQYDYAPIELEAFAWAALKVEDDEAFRKAAEAFLEAKKVFESAMAERDIEEG